MKTDKLPALKPKQVIKVLEKAGFVFKRQKGSHKIYINYTEKKAVTISFHNKDLKKGTLRNIIKQSGLKTEGFVKLL
ncbi:MAG: type II toxin-antitoxin system HicA family toxin [Candidatus Colwellbacteria bacterium]|nr:type II toxin-antitoxin system HicA family toxin [Candidatus Colwellbacteria bacterium]